MRGTKDGDGGSIGTSHEGRNENGRGQLAPETRRGSLWSGSFRGRYDCALSANFRIDPNRETGPPRRQLAKTRSRFVRVADGVAKLLEQKRYSTHTHTKIRLPWDIFAFSVVSAIFLFFISFFTQNVSCVFSRFLQMTALREMSVSYQLKKTPLLLDDPLRKQIEELPLKIISHHVLVISTNYSQLTKSLQTRFL